MATVAIGHRYAAERLVGNVVNGRTIGRWIGAAVAGRALVRHRHLAVIPAGGFPAIRRVAAGAIERRADVAAGFAGGRTSVVAAGAVGCRGHCTVIHTARGQPARGLMAGAAGCLRHEVAGGLAGCRCSIVATGAPRAGDAHVIEFGAGKGDCGMAGFAAQLGLEVLGWFEHIGSGQARTTDVATGALAGRAFEYSIDVTGLTPRIGMQTRELKAGFDVVKIPGCGLRKNSATAQHQEQCQHGPQQTAKDGIVRIESCHGRSFLSPPAAYWLAPDAGTGSQLPPVLFLKFFQLSLTWHCSHRVPNCPSCTSSFRWQAMQLLPTGAASFPLGAGNLWQLSQLTLRCAPSSRYLARRS